MASPFDSTGFPAGDNGHVRPARILGPDGLPYRSDAPEADFAVGHNIQFASILSSGFRAYWHGQYDEAMRHSREDALAMRNDAWLMSLLQERQLATVSLPYRIEVDDERDPLQKAVQEGLLRIVRQIPNFRKLVMYMMETVWYGRYGSQIKWGWRNLKLPSLKDPKKDEDRKALVVLRHLPINGDKIGHHWDGTPYVSINPAYASSLKNAEISPTTSGAMALYLRGSWRWRYIIGSHNAVDADFFDSSAADAVHGVGIRSVLFWLDWLRKEWLSNVADWCERTGLGIRLWYYQGNNPQSKKEVMKAASESNDRTNIFIPRYQQGGGKTQEGVEFVDTSSTGADLLLKLQSHIEEHQERFVIGQSLSGGRGSGDGLGGEGKSKLARDTKNQIIEYDAGNIGEYFTTDLIKPIQHWTFKEPEARAVNARLVFGVEQAEPEKLLGAVKTFVLELGGKVRESEVRSLIGLQAVQEGDQVISLESIRKQQGQGGTEGQPGSPPGPGLPIPAPGGAGVPPGTPPQPVAPAADGPDDENPESPPPGQSPNATAPAIPLPGAEDQRPTGNADPSQIAAGLEDITKKGEGAEGPVPGGPKGGHRHYQFLGRWQHRMSPLRYAWEPHRHPRDLHGKFVEAMQGHAHGELKHVGGLLVRRLGDDHFGLDTERGHIKGTASKIADHIVQDHERRRLEGKPWYEALDRTEGWTEPDVFFAPAAADAEFAGFARLPKGARVVSLDPQTIGRLGTVVKNEQGHNTVKMDGTADVVASVAFEPLDKRLSWRIEGMKSGPAKQRGLFDPPEAGDEEEPPEAVDGEADDVSTGGEGTGIPSNGAAIEFVHAEPSPNPSELLPWQMSRGDYAKLALRAYHNKKLSKKGTRFQSNAAAEGRDKNEEANAIPAHIWEAIQGKGKKTFEGGSTEALIQRVADELNHRESVRKAIESGNQVPPHVLADYPEFIKTTDQRQLNARPEKKKHARGPYAELVHYQANRKAADVPKLSRYSASSWTKYTGPHGGHGWQNANNPEDIRYQKDRPGEHEAKSAEVTSPAPKVGEVVTEVEPVAVIHGAGHADRNKELLGKIMSGEIFSTSSMASASEGTVNERYDALRQVAADLGAAHAPDARMAALFVAIKARLQETGREPRHPGWHKAERLIQRFNEEYAEGGGTPQDITETANFARNIEDILTPDQREHVVKALSLDVQPPGGSIADGVRKRLLNASAEQEAKAKTEREDRERQAREQADRKADIAPFPPEPMPEAGNRPPARPPEFADKRTELDPWEWDGTIDTDHIVGNPQYEADIAEWNFRDDGENHPQCVRLVTVDYDPNPDDPDAPLESLYRWESYDDDTSYFSDEGEWTADPEKAKQDGKRFAGDSHDEKPDEDDGDSEDDGDETDQDIRDLFGVDDLGVEFEQKGNVVYLSHPNIDQCKRTLHDHNGTKWIHNNIFEMVKSKQGQGFGPKVFAAQVKGASAAGYDYIETHAARNDGTYNGYYTWVALGYDAPLNDLSSSVRAKILGVVPDAESVLDLMEAGDLDLDEKTVKDMRKRIEDLADVAGSEESKAKLRAKAKKSVLNGSDYWLAYGEDLEDARFDLSEGSRSRERLQNNMRKKS